MVWKIKWFLSKLYTKHEPMWLNRDSCPLLIIGYFIWDHRAVTKCHRPESIWSVWKYTYENGFRKHAFLWIYVKRRVIIQRLKRIDKKKLRKQNVFASKYVCCTFYGSNALNELLHTRRSSIKGKKGTFVPETFSSYFRTKFLWDISLSCMMTICVFPLKTWTKVDSTDLQAKWKWHTRNICKSQIKCELVNFLPVTLFLDVGCRVAQSGCCFQFLPNEMARTFFDIILFYFLYLLQNATVSLYRRKQMPLCSWSESDLSLFSSDAVLFP